MGRGRDGRWGRSLTRLQNTGYGGRVALATLVGVGLGVLQRDLDDPKHEVFHCERGVGATLVRCRLVRCLLQGDDKKNQVINLKKVKLKIK